jgi:hypothetical protein
MEGCRRWAARVLFPVGVVAMLLPAGGARAAEPATALRTHNVLVVTLDGMRWQEVFSGFDAAYNDEAGGGIRKPEPVAARFSGPTPEARRARLMPFLWTVVSRDGQILGDPAHGSRVVVTNGLRFSYPGYNELFTGAPDPRIDSNDKKVNPNRTVFEWLSGRFGFEGRVAVFGSWDVFPFIFATERSGLPVWGSELPFPEPLSDRERLLDAFAADLPRYFPSGPFDAPVMQGALEYLRTRQPRVLAVLLGETDEWAHDRRYDQYLDAAQRADAFVRRLWEEAQALPAYRGTTALVLATDHGRGATPADWTDHGQKIEAADRIWMAVMGPDTPALGVREGVQATQSQLAATIAALLGEDYDAAEPKAAKPLPDLR